MLASGLPELVGDDEALARILNSSSQFNSLGVKPSAFLPSEDQETSVFRHDCNPPDELWILGAQTVSHGRRIHGAAIVKTSTVRACGLDVLSDEPPLKHAVIRKWLICEDPQLQKAQQTQLAINIASKSELIKKI